jgi:hypothetical protein
VGYTVILFGPPKDAPTPLYIQQIDFQNYSSTPWKGFPATRRKSLIN